MTARELRKIFGAARERVARLENELRACEQGPRSRADAKQAISRAIDELAAPFKDRLRKGLLNEPAPKSGLSGDARAHAEQMRNWRASINLQSLDARSLGGMLSGAGVGTTDLSFLAWAHHGALEGELHGALDALPGESFGLSEEQRHKKAEQLERDLQKARGELDALTDAWEKEVGSGVALTAE